MSWHEDAAETFKAPGEPWLVEASKDLNKELNTSVDFGLKQKPESYANTRKASKNLNIPLDIAERNPQEINELSKRDDLFKRLQDSEKVKRAFKSPEFAALAHEDVDSLVKLEKNMSSIRGPVAGYMSFMEGVHVQAVEGMEKVRQGIRLQWADLIGSERMREDALKKMARAETRVQIHDPEFKSETMQGVYGGVTSLVRQMPALAAGVATRNPALTLGYMGQTVEAEAYGKYRARGGTALEALTGGMGEGAVEVLTELTPMKFLVGKFGKVGFGDFITGLLAREIPQEQIATIAQDALDTAIANPDKTWGEYAKERPDAAYQTLISTIVQTGLIGTASKVASKFASDTNMSQESLDAQETLDEQVKTAEEINMRKHSPEEFKQFLQDVGVEDDVFLSPEDAQVFFQKNPEILETLPEEISEAITESLVSGVDVVIPKSEYLTYLTDYHDQLSDVIRNDQDGMTAKEANEWVEQGTEQFEKEAEKILEEMELNTEFQTSADKVYTNIRDQIVKTGFSEDVADKYAALHRAFSVTLADKLGKTPTEVYEQVQFISEPVEDKVFEQADLEKISFAEHTEYAKGFKTGEPVTFNYVHSTESATKIFGIPSRDAPFGRGYEPSGRYIISVSKKAKPSRKGMITGEVTFDNPLVIDNKNLKWKKELSDAYGGLTGKELSKALIRDGYDGVVTVDISDKPNKTHISEILDLTTFKEEKALFQDRKGFFDPSSNVIGLLKNADLSTALHELGHAYFEAYKNLAPQSPEIAKDMQFLLDFIEVENLETWDGMTLEQRREGHEKVARAFEAYLFEGKSPSIEMQGLFQRFRDWLLNVYKSLKNLNVQLTDEVRQVFDRMLATEEQIREKEVMRSYEPLFETPEEAGMTDSEWVKYQNLDLSRRSKSVEDLQSRSLRDMKWLANAKGRALKRLQKESKEKRKAMRSEVSDEVSRETIYQAIRFIKKGETALDGEVTTAETHKLDTETLKELYPDTDLRSLRGMTGEGLHPDVVAEMFGLTSGDQLVRDLIEAEPQKDRVERLTDQRMLEAYGDLTDPIALDRAAETAIHNDAHTRFLHTELTALSKRTGSRNILAKAAKDYAERSISRKKVRDLKPGQFAAAEARAARNAEKALGKGDRQTAAEHKRAQILNNHFFKAANKAQDDVDKMLRYFKRVMKSKLDPDYMDQIHSLLEDYDLKKGVSITELAKRKSLLEWAAIQEAEKLDPIIDERLLAAKKQHYKDTPIDELRGLRDAIKNIEHLGRLKNRLLTAKDKREFNQRMDLARMSIRENATRKVKERGTPTDIVGRSAQVMRGLAAIHRKPASYAREMDGSKDGGEMWNLYIRPMNESGDNETERSFIDTKAMAEIFKPIMKSISKGGLPLNILAAKKLIPGTDFSMSKEQTLMFAMNWGNEGNRQRLLDGGMTGRDSISQQEAQAILDTLTKQDLTFVQDVLDYIESKKPEIAAQERRLTGVEPEWIEASPIATKNGVIPGGYFPAIYDTVLSTRSEELEASTNLRMAMKGAFNAAATRSSYTQKRAKEVKGRPLLLSFNSISRHLNEVNHRLSWQDWVVDANRTLKALDPVIREHYGPEALQQFRSSVEDISSGEDFAKQEWEKIIDHVRKGTTVVGMGWRFTTAIIQPTGLAQSWYRVGGEWMAKGINRYRKNPLEAARVMKEKSTAARFRALTMQREVNEILNTVRANKQLTVAKSTFFLFIQKMQQTVDVPTWWGAYYKAQKQLGAEKAQNDAERDMIEEKSISMADQAVIDSQSGGQLKDLARIQRGNPMLKLWTNFFSYFSTTYNLNVEAFRKAKLKDPVSVGIYAGDVLIINVLPALLAVALREVLKNECKGDMECLAKKVGREQVTFITGQTLPTRELSAGIEAALGLPSYGYHGPAGISFFNEVYKLGQQVSQEEADWTAIKTANKVAGTILHYPAGQINSTIEGIMAIENGEVEGFGTVGAVLAGPPR